MAEAGDVVDIGGGGWADIEDTKRVLRAQIFEQLVPSARVAVDAAGVRSAVCVRVGVAAKKAADFLASFSVLGLGLVKERRICTSRPSVCGGSGSRG